MVLTFTFSKQVFNIFYIHMIYNLKYEKELAA